MLQRFFEEPLPNDPLSVDTTPLFEGLRIWDTDDGRYREHHGAYPVVRFSFNGLKRTTPIDFLEDLESAVAAEFQRHSYLEESAALSSFERDLFARLAQGRAAAGEVSQSLLTLSRLLTKHHKSRTVILIDEYNAPIMAAYTHGYYSEAVDFLKSWLTGALKGNDSLAFACLTGVQRISKESIFSDLNNLTVNTSMSVVFPDIGTREEVLWSMLYLAGYLTTNDVELPNNKRLPRTLRIPNREIAELYRTEITERCRAAIGRARATRCPASLGDPGQCIPAGRRAVLHPSAQRKLLRSRPREQLSYAHAGIAYGHPRLRRSLIEPRGRPRPLRHPAYALLRRQTPHHHGVQASSAQAIFRETALVISPQGP